MKKRYNSQIGCDSSHNGDLNEKFYIAYTNLFSIEFSYRLLKYIIFPHFLLACTIRELTLRTNIFREQSSIITTLKNVLASSSSSL